MAYVRNYSHEYTLSKERGEQGTGHNSGGAERMRARRLMLKKGMVKKGDDVDHKVPISKGGTDALSNLRDRSVHGNRSFPRNSDGSMKYN